MELKSYTNYVKASRFVHCLPKQEGKPHRVLILDPSSGGTVPYDCTQEVFLRVMGEPDTTGNMAYAARNSLRRVRPCQFICWLNADNAIVSVDRIPVSFFLRGAAPTTAIKARDEGFIIEYDSSIKGLEVKEVYAGMGERDLIFLLKDIRAEWAKRGRTKSARFDKLRVEQVEEDRLRVTARGLETYVG